MLSRTTLLYKRLPTFMGELSTTSGAHSGVFSMAGIHGAAVNNGGPLGRLLLSTTGVANMMMTTNLETTGRGQEFNTSTTSLGGNTHYNGMSQASPPSSQSHRMSTGMVYCPPAVNAKSTPKAERKLKRFFRRVMRFITGRDGLKIIGAVVIGIAATATGLLTPIVLGELWDSFIAGTDIYWPLAKMIAVQSGGVILSFCGSVLLSQGVENIGNQIRFTLFQALLQQDIANFDRHSTGKLGAMLNDDVKAMQTNLREVMQTGVSSATKIIGGTITLFYISPKLTLALGASVIPLIVLGNHFGYRLRDMSSSAQESSAHASGVANESLRNIRVVRAFTAEELEKEKYSSALDDAADKKEKLGICIGGFHSALSLSVQAVMTGTLWASGRLVEAGEITKGQVASFLMQASSMQNAVESLSMLFSKSLRAAGAGSRVMKYIESEVDTNRAGGLRWCSPSNPDGISGDVELKDVWFAYPVNSHHCVFTGLNLYIPAGSTVALVGSSGGGKSTVAALLERFYEPTKGKILIDGVDLSQTDIHWLRSQMAVVPQDPLLFQDSIENNIRYGNPSATDAEVEEAATIAGCDFAFNFSKGLKTPLAEAGSSLSGGQKQRIAIARALVRKPRILILDEATSALDAKTESLLQNSLNSLSNSEEGSIAKTFQNTTTIVIAHRLSTIRNADNIAVLSDGQVVEQGTHQELMKRSGAYYTLVKHQQGREQIEEKLDEQKH